LFSIGEDYERRDNIISKFHKMHRQTPQIFKTLFRERCGDHRDHETTTEEQEMLLERILDGRMRGDGPGNDNYSERQDAMMMTDDDDDDGHFFFFHSSSPLLRDTYIIVTILAR